MFKFKICINTNLYKYLLCLLFSNVNIRVSAFMLLHPYRVCTCILIF